MRGAPFGLRIALQFRAAWVPGKTRADRAGAHLQGYASPGPGTRPSSGAKLAWAVQVVDIWGRIESRKTGSHLLKRPPLLLAVRSLVPPRDGVEPMLEIEPNDVEMLSIYEAVDAPRTRRIFISGLCMYLLNKQARPSMSLASPTKSAFFRLGFEEGVYRLLWVGNDQPFLFRSALPLLRFGLTFVCHTVVSSHRFLNGVMPQPGIGPGRRGWARDCKSRLSASSSTGAQRALNVGAGNPSKCAAPTCSGPNGAALNPSSFHASYSVETKPTLRRQ